MKICHITQNNNKPDCIFMMFCLCNVKHNTQNQNNKDPDRKYPDPQLHRSYSFLKQNKT